MSRKNTFLPLIEYRNQKRRQEIKNSLQSINQNVSLKSIKNYESIFDDDSFKFNKLIDKKDDQSSKLIRKYFSKFQGRKQRKKKHDENYKKDSKALNLINFSQSLDLRIENKPKLIKISPLSKSIAISNCQKHSQGITKQKKSITKLLTEEQYDQKVRFIKFPIKILDDPFRSKQQLLLRYGIMKTEISKSMQNNLKVKNYKWKNSYDSYLQKIKRSSDSKLAVHHSQRLESQSEQLDEKLYNKKYFKIKTQDTENPLKNDIKYKNQQRKLQRSRKKLKKKTQKQTFYDINPWTNDKNQIEMRDIMR